MKEEWVHNKPNENQRSWITKCKQIMHYITTLHVNTATITKKEPNYLLDFLFIRFCTLNISDSNDISILHMTYRIKD